MSTKTHSEELFEQYLNGRSIHWEHEPPVAGKQKRPDYRVECGERALWLEVKEFDEPDPKPKGGFSPCPAISEKLDQARKKFKEYKDDCCVLVLHNCRSAYRSTETGVVLSAMFGEYRHNDSYDEGRIVNEPERFRFSGKSKLSASRNTSISAVVVLQHYCVDERMVSIINELLFRQRRGEVIAPGANIQLLSERQDEPREISHEGTVRVIVLENPYARYPFPADLFRGPFDQHWTIADGCYSMTWIGSELERLLNRPSPVPFILL